MSNYPEIRALQELYDKHKVRIQVVEADALAEQTNHVKVSFSLGSQSFILYIDDEYKDLELNNPLLSLTLVLFELEDYEDEEDFLRWCMGKGLSASNSLLLDYYRDLAHIYASIKKILGSVESKISGLDFQLNAGAAQELRRT